MTIQEAIKSGKPFKCGAGKKMWFLVDEQYDIIYWDQDDRKAGKRNALYIPPSDIVSDEWITK